MNAPPALPVPGLTLALLLAAGPLAAQSEPEPRPSRGKIDGVEREVRRENRGDDGDGGSCDDCDGTFFLVRVIGGALQMFFSPAAVPGQGYTRYPYAERDNPDAFAMPGMATGRTFGTVSGMYFDDRTVGGTLQAGQFALEGGNGIMISSLEYTLYREPTRRDTDWMHLARAAFGVAPRMGRHAYARFLVGARGIILDNAESGWGPEVEFGVQVFPVRPWGVAATARGALVSWSRGGESGFSDLLATGSYFLGRLEIQAGWRHTKVGAAQAFNGPTAGVRVWF